MRRALVCGAGGFIGSHLVKRLKAEGFFVIGADLKSPEFSPSPADDYQLIDLRDPQKARWAVHRADVVYQLAADMGGAGYLFTGIHDAEVMRNCSLINLNVLHMASLEGVERIFFSSSACVYPTRNQEDPDNPVCSEDSTYPADPDSDYGWEKLYAERLYDAYRRNHGIKVRVARLHGIFGPEGTWTGGREKSVSAICRKVAEAPDGGSIDVWGDGEQTRSYLYIDECVEGIRRLMESNFSGPVNIGSEELVSINCLASMAMEISGKRLSIKHVPGPLGVRGRNSDNRLISEKLGWKPSQPLRDGLEKTYRWIESKVKPR